MDVVDHLSGLFAIVGFVASLSIYCTWSFHVAFNWDCARQLLLLRPKEIYTAECFPGVF